MLFRASIALLLWAQAAFATPDAATKVTDQLLWVGEDRFVVLRTSELGFSSYYKLETRFERVEISVWDGRILSRCSLGVQQAEDATGEGDWVVTNIAPDAGCSAAPGAAMTHPGPLLHPGRRVEAVEGALVLMSPDGTQKPLADAEFVRSRVVAMLAAERQACETQGNDWPTFGGCFLGEETETCEVQSGIRATEERLFLSLKCGDPDFDNSLVWLAIGRAFWDPERD
jgi:hypothetical protein